ncbi:hypothetical protein HYQ44_009749 [Verticillium longisporum]|nr:hypothetical protein HYQ44_009749 [Verticillium longisporum]
MVCDTGPGSSVIRYVPQPKREGMPHTLIYTFSMQFDDVAVVRRSTMSSRILRCVVTINKIESTWFTTIISMGYPAATQL